MNLKLIKNFFIIFSFICSMEASQRGGPGRFGHREQPAPGGGRLGHRHGGMRPNGDSHPLRGHRNENPKCGACGRELELEFRGKDQKCQAISENYKCSPGWIEDGGYYVMEEPKFRRHHGPMGRHCKPDDDRCRKQFDEQHHGEREERKKTKEELNRKHTNKIAPYGTRVSAKSKITLETLLPTIKTSYHWVLESKFSNSPLLLWEMITQKARNLNLNSNINDYVFAKSIVLDESQINYLVCLSAIRYLFDSQLSSIEAAAEHGFSSVRHLLSKTIATERKSDAIKYLSMINAKENCKYEQWL